MLYIGEGAFWPDVPARDLTEAEVTKFGKELLLATGLYVEAADKPKVSLGHNPQSEEMK